jgi:alpha/beta superfamily hydrolase
VTARQREKVVVIALDQGRFALEGIFVAAPSDTAGGAVLAPPHPLYGGSMESPVLNELAYACEEAGIASLRFNWRGVGASAGEPSGEAADADADYRAATAYLEETVPGPMVACGYSFGAAAALRVGVARPRIARLMLVSPPLALLDPPALTGFAGPALVVAGENDAFAPPAGLEGIVTSAPRARLEVVPEADHFFLTGLAAIGRTAAAWLRETGS